MYRQPSGRKSIYPSPKTDNAQWKSNVNRRKIYNAVYTMANQSKTRTREQGRPVCMVVTSPSEFVNHSELFTKFTHNLTNGYKVDDYIWVKEYQKNGRPHWHMVANIPFFDIERLNAYWCRLNNAPSTSPAIRLNPKPTRFLHSNPLHCARYLAKYFSKDLTQGRKIGRTFAISPKLASLSEPTEHWLPEFTRCDSYHWRPFNKHVTLGFLKSSV